MANLMDKKKAKSTYDKEYRARNKDKISARMKIYYTTITDEQKELRKEYRKSIQENMRTYGKQYYRNNTEKTLEYSKQWYQANKSRKSVLAKEWKIINRGTVNALAAKRRAIKLNATPKWADLNAIMEFYKNCPDGYHVDHIIPLQGKNVCGLHVLENLQYLPASENMSKGNKY